MKNGVFPCSDRVKRLIAGLLAAGIAVGAVFGLAACSAPDGGGGEQTPDGGNGGGTGGGSEDAATFAYAYGDAETVTPFWFNVSGDETVVYNEIVVPILYGGRTLASGYLAYEPTEIISVRDYTLGREYGKDEYTVSGRRITVTVDDDAEIGEGMPYIRDEWLDAKNIPDEFMDNVSPDPAMYNDGGGTNRGKHVVAEGSLTRTNLLHVTYAFDHTEQDLGFEPQAYTPERFSRLTAKLEAGEPVRMLVLGDSICVGASASSFAGFEPNLPTFFDLIADELAARYYDGDREMIELVNVSVGGEASDYGVSVAEGGETDLADFDFVIIGFGMNDGTLGVTKDVFTSNTERMIDGIREHSPDADFAVLGCFTPNPRSIFFGIQSQYIEPVTALCDKKNTSASGCTYVGMYDLSSAILQNKQRASSTQDTRYRYIDISANYTNHPNDFMVRLYAGSVLSAFLPFESTAHPV